MQSDIRTRATTPLRPDAFVRSRAKYSSRDLDRMLDEIRREAKRCRACSLWKIGAQTVLGERPGDAKVMVVGEQPGDREDLEGRPFVGPAGRLLNQAIEEAGLDRASLYVTNAVKHFKHELRGKRRVHKSPTQREIAACNQWLQREIGALKPDLIVTLGASAARAVFGRTMPVLSNRGRVHSLSDSPCGATRVLATVHPSYLLRIRPPERAAALAAFVKDLKIASSFVKRRKSAREAAH